MGAGQGDAARNRKTYHAIREIIERARKVRINHPEAFALPHLYENMLMEKLPPLVTIKHGFLKYQTPDVRNWYWSDVTPKKWTCS